MIAYSQRWLELKTDPTLLVSSKLVSTRAQLTHFSSQICLPPSRWNQFQLCKLLILVYRLTQDSRHTTIKRNGRGVKVTFTSRLLVKAKRYRSPRYHLGYHGVYVNSPLISQVKRLPTIMDYQFFRATQQSLARFSLSDKDNRWQALLLHVA